MYASYHTHADAIATSILWRIWSRMRDWVWAARFAYRTERVAPAARRVGTLLGLFPPLLDLAGGELMWLSSARPGRLLDVGSGNGSFIARMRDGGWEVLGLEPDPVPARRAQELLGVPVVVGTDVDALARDGQSFDAITLGHVIEHVPEPVEMLRSCRALLKPGGRLVVVTPNVTSLGHRLFRRSWRGLEPPRHLHLFSTRTLVEVARRAGLREDRIIVRTTARIAPFMWCMSRALRAGHTFSGGRLTLIPLSQQLQALGFFLLEGMSRGMGEEILMVATKDHDRAAS